jgi:hypothetical protein
MKRRIPIYGKAVLVFLVALFVFLVVVPLVSAPIPGQLFGWYIVTTLVAILLYVSSTEAFWEEFATPLRRLLLARTAITKSAERPRRSRRGWIGVGRAGLNAQEPNNTHAVLEPSMGEGTAWVEAPAFMPGRTSTGEFSGPWHDCPVIGILLILAYF